MATETRVGEAVLCRSGSYSDQLATTGRSGLVVEYRRSHARIFFPDDGRSYWIPIELLRRYAPGSIPSSEPLGKLSALVGFFEDVETVEIEMGASESQMVVVHGAIDVKTIDAIRAFLGSGIRSFEIAPVGMHRISSTVRWVAG